MSEKIICYLGPSLPLYRAVELCPNIIFRPPAIQGDIMSDAVEVQPDRILLVDGCFLQNLSVWHKEIIFALTKGIKVYGASSMGALRAADLWRQGMIGCGKIFEWYKNGLTEDDSEVALLYRRDSKGIYQSLTIPVVDIRATIMHYAELLQMGTDHQEMILTAAKALHFSVRSASRLLETWKSIIGQATADLLVNNLLTQKAFDAETLLSSYSQLEPDPVSQIPTQVALSRFFWAAYDRDRRVTINQTRVVQQHIDAYIALHAIDYHQIFWDARNFHLSVMLAEKLGVELTEQDVERERRRFCARYNLSHEAEVNEWIKANNLSFGEFMILVIRMATVRKLHEWLSSSLVPVESTKITLDYLKMHNSYTYWAKECADKEAKLQQIGAEEQMSITFEKEVETQLAEHCQKSGQTVDGSVDDFISETGFTSRYELSVALERLKALE